MTGQRGVVTDAQNRRQGLTGPYSPGRLRWPVKVSRREKGDA